VFQGHHLKLQIKFTGATYSSRIGLEDENADVQDIDLQPLTVSPESSSLLYFDLETTGLRKSFNTGLNRDLIFLCTRPTCQICPCLVYFFYYPIFLAHLS
jgi:hypothetical protein